MSTAVARAEVPVVADPRMAAFLAPGCPEVFHSVATSTSIWQADPYDVETIHAEARAAFERLLYRGGRTPPPPSGAVLVLAGGKRDWYDIDKMGSFGLWFGDATNSAGRSWWNGFSGFKSRRGANAVVRESGRLPSIRAGFAGYS